MHHERDTENQTEKRNHARDSGQDVRADAIKQAYVERQKVPGVPHEEAGHQHEQKPLETPQSSLSQDEDHQEEVDKRPERVNDQLGGHEESKFRGNIHGQPRARETASGYKRREPTGRDALYAKAPGLSTAPGQPEKLRSRRRF